MRPRLNVASRPCSPWTVIGNAGAVWGIGLAGCGPAGAVSKADGATGRVSMVAAATRTGRTFSAHLWASMPLGSCTRKRSVPWRLQAATLDCQAIREVMRPAAS